MRPYFISASLWLFLLALEVTSQLPIHRPTTQDDYFSIVWARNHTLVGFIDTKTHPTHANLMTKLFNRLSQDTLLSDWDFSLVIADVSQIEMLYNHYSMGELPNLFHFVRKQLVKCPHFAATFAESLSSKNEDELVDFGQDWIHNGLHNMALELLSLSDFERRLGNHKIIAVYFGKKDSNFQIFRRWTSKYIHFHFFYTFSDQLKRDIFVSRHLSEPPMDTPFLAVIRHTDLITELDPQPIVATLKIGSERELGQFFDFERFPRLINASMGSNITQMMFYNNEKLVVMVTSTSTPKEDIAIYHQALAELPKRMIYSQVDMNSVHIAAFMQLFMLAKVNMTPGKVYAVHVLPSRAVEIRDMTGGLTVRNILSFVGGVIEEHADHFGVPRVNRRPEDDEQEEDIESNRQPINTDL